jgi:hypothetical protein
MAFPKERNSPSFTVKYEITIESSGSARGCIVVATVSRGCASSRGTAADVMSCHRSRSAKDTGTPNGAGISPRCAPALSYRPGPLCSRIPGWIRGGRSTCSA